MIPLGILAVLSVVGGFALSHPMESWLGRTWGVQAKSEKALKDLKSPDEEVRRHAVSALAKLGHDGAAKARAAGAPEEVAADLERREAAKHRIHLGMMGVSALIFAVGAGGGFWVHTRGRRKLRELEEGALKRPYQLALNKFYVDELYEILILAPVKVGATVTWFLVDRLLIDTVGVAGTARLPSVLGSILRRPHTGTVNAAGVSFLLGALGVLGYLVFRYRDAWTSLF
jgi:NADH:ubiquinone oxidoreductase subunit 5 (subunit L)/multisubunit Na+/H+ antiporter MnhA subunit